MMVKDAADDPKELAAALPCAANPENYLWEIFFRKKDERFH